jgi:hypothetical protein
MLAAQAAVGSNDNSSGGRHGNSSTHSSHPGPVLLAVLVVVPVGALRQLYPTGSPNLTLLLLLLQEGDLLVHFPGGMKKAIASIDNSNWLKAVPLLPSKLGDASARPPWFTVARASSRPAADQGRAVHVSMRSNIYAKNSTMRREFELYVEPQLEGFDNWGWPIAPEPEGFRPLLQKQLLQRQQEQYGQYL